MTAKGKPSGTATTTMVTAIKNPLIMTYKLSIQRKQWSPIIIFTIKWIYKAIIVNPAEIVPIFPISSATVSNFCCKGVGGDSS